MDELLGQTDKVGNIECLGSRGRRDTANLKGGIEHVLGKAVGAHGIADSLATLSKCGVDHAGHKLAIEPSGTTPSTRSMRTTAESTCGAGIKQRGGTSKRPVTCVYRPSFAV